MFEKSKVAQDAYEEGHKIRWKQAKVLQIEPNTTYKESAYTSMVHQPSLDISPIWTRIIIAETRKLQLYPV
jgi:hypothetical protein